MAARFIRVGSRAAGAVAGAAGTAAALGPAAARAPVAVAHPPERVGKLVDDSSWELLSLTDGQEAVLFNTFTESDIDRAVEDVHALFAPKPLSARPSVTIEEEGPLSPNASSDGSEANGVIAGTSIPRPVSLNASEQQLGDLLRITSKLLKRPGLQREVVQCMMEDEEVRQLMLRQAPDLDNYLMAVGIPPMPALLGPATAALHSTTPAVGEEGASEGQAGREEGGEDVVAKLVKAVATGLEKTGSALAFLGGWLRDRFDDMRGARGEEAEQEGGEQATEGASPRQQAQRSHTGGPQRTKTDTVLGSVMMVAMVVVCMLVIRRPLATLRVVPLRRL